MHIVSRPSMLALTVDRLVGTGHSPHHHHLPLSPSSDSSGGSSTSPAPTKPTPTTPSHFSKITLLLSNNSPPNRNSSPVLISCEERAVVKVKEEPEVKMETDRCLTATPDSVITANPDRCRLCPSAHQEDSQSDEDDGCSSASRSPRLADDHCCGRTGPESPHRNINTSITPSSLSSPQPQQSLKFSIHDILRPDFGQRALSRPTVQHSYLSVPQPGHHRVHPYKPQNSRSRNSSGLSTSASTVVEPRRPSSVKTHSEDSNSSSTSRTTAREEVVDESKVNPAVPKGPLLWPAWVYCTRYSDRPSSGPRSRRIVRTKGEETRRAPSQHEGDEKRPRTAFTAEQLGKLKREFDENRYLTEKRRQDLARDLKLHENQIKIWFQNKRAKLKKSSGQRGGLALQLMAQGLYNHSTVGVDEEEDYLPC